MDGDSITVEEKVSTVIDCYNQLDIENETQKQIKHYHHLATESILKLSLSKEKLEALISLSTSMLKRKA
jgi:geranylgeranyl pyrophosphate synthase